MSELARVLARSKFDAYVSVEERRQFLRLLGRIAETVPILNRVQACRDPKDDMVLEMAVNGEADLIVTGDTDLLALGTFRDIPIITQATYLARVRRPMASLQATPLPAPAAARRARCRHGSSR
jgi:predicted nucleic acid-binding protein